MSFMQSAWGRALGGAGAAAAGIANKYISEEIENNRAQLLADIAHNNRVRADEYDLSPERQAKVRQNATDATMAQGTAKRADELAGMQDTTYQGAITAKKDADATADTRRKIDSEKQAITELTPAKVAAEKQAIEALAGTKAKAAGLMARASDLDGGNRALRAQLLGMEVKDRKRLGELYDDYLSIVNDATMQDDEKAKKLSPITNAIGALKMKSSPAAARNSEFDTEKVTEEREGPNGEIIKTERVQKRMPGKLAEREEATDPMKAAMDAARAARGK